MDARASCEPGRTVEFRPTQARGINISSLRAVFDHLNDVFGDTMGASLASVSGGQAEYPGLSAQLS